MPTLYTVQSQSISTRLVTRGYLGSVPGQKRFVRVQVLPVTWWPEFSLSAQADGAAETQVISGSITRDRTKYFTWNTPDYETDNSNDDFFEPKREDYSIALAADGEISLGANGIDPDLHQESQVKRLVQIGGRHLRIVVEGIRGRTAIRGVEVAAVPGLRRGGNIA